MVARAEINPMQRNVFAGKAVKELLTMVPTVLNEDVEEGKFWEVLAMQAATRCGMALVTPKDAEAEAMNDRDARSFEDIPVPYGTHKGERVGDVSPRYFIGLLDGEFGRNLRRYVRSRRFRERQL